MIYGRDRGIYPINSGGQAKVSQIESPAKPSLRWCCEHSWACRTEGCVCVRVSPLCRAAQPLPPPLLSTLAPSISHPAIIKEQLISDERFIF